MSFDLGLSGSHTSSKSKSSSDNTIDATSLGLFNQAFNPALAAMGQLDQTPYAGPLGAGLDPLQIQAAQMAGANAGVGQSQVANATQIAQQVGGYTPQQVQAGSVGGMDLSGYMNPYQDMVLNSGLDRLDEFRKRALVGNSQSAGEGAWGGSRHGVADSLTNEAALTQANDFISSILQGGYDRATGLATSDLNRGLTAAQSNQSAGLQGAGLNLNAADSLTNFGQVQNQLGANDATLVNSFGAQAQATQQNQNQMALDEYIRQQQLPLLAAQGWGSLAGQVPIVVDNKSKGKNTGTSFGATASATYGGKG